MNRKGQKTKTDPKVLARNKASYAKNKEKYKPTREKWQSAHREEQKKYKKKYNSEPRNKKRLAKWSHDNFERRKDIPEEAEKLKAEKLRSNQKITYSDFSGIFKKMKERVLAVARIAKGHGI